MAEQVGPPESAPPTAEPTEKILTRVADAVHQKPQSAMPIGTYIIHIPKDQVYRIPPPENTTLFEKYTHRKNRRSPCCCICCWLLAFLFSFTLLVAIAGCVIYLVLKPKSPNYTVTHISVRNFNLSSPEKHISPEFDVTVRAHNTNEKVGIYYEMGSFVNVFFNAVRLADGVLPAFYQPSNNVTVMKTVLIGSNVELTSDDRAVMVEAHNEGRVPLRMYLRVPVRMKAGLVKTWEIAVKVNCRVTVTELTQDATLVSKQCNHNVEL